MPNGLTRACLVLFLGSEKMDTILLYNHSQIPDHYLADFGASRTNALLLSDALD